MAEARKTINNSESRELSSSLSMLHSRNNKLDQQHQQLTVGGQLISIRNLNGSRKPSQATEVLRLNMTPLKPNEKKLHKRLQNRSIILKPGGVVVNDPSNELQ